MNYQNISQIQELTNVTDRKPHLTRHEVTFQMRLVSFKGQPVTDDTSFGDALMSVDNKVYDALPYAVTGWTYRDHDGIEGGRLEMFQPEHGYDNDLPESTALYDVSVGATRELPTMRADATDANPISIEQLVEEVVPLLIRLYGETGVEMALHRVKFYKHYESSADGYYDLQ